MTELVRLAAETVGRKPPAVRVPEIVARPLATVLETAWSALGRQAEPILTRGKIDIVARDRCYSARKASELLGYQPRIGYVDGLRTAARWLEAEGLL